MTGSRLSLRTHLARKDNIQGGGESRGPHLVQLFGSLQVASSLPGCSPQAAASRGKPSGFLTEACNLS
ncbi:hypothetical protein E2C01_004727 [Portunus trituberculatus]|uniref:Uncharacterized protein n=1 Tax=Portunus trituberculatus TaxID=210409 RepID=A0A5B7CRH2_PORTR|nr:hypothetical protein [Portunus trituberculatus]